MARTRGASFNSRGESSRGESSQGESSSQGEARRRPTVSARRSRAAPIQHDPIAEERAVEEQTYEAYETHGEEHADVHDIQEDVAGFPGGPHDHSLLTHYVQHVAYAISQGRDRGDTLKLISHGKKVNKLGPCHEGIQDIVLNSSLMPLTGICYDYVDKGLLLGFIERWHFETSSFHLPIGEMSITLDDVSTLLHLPVMGQMCDLEELEFEEARTALVQLLGVDGGTAGAEMEDARGPKVRLSWLREIYVQRCESQHWDYAARAYLLHLVGCTIFANKSASSIRVSYLLLFRDVHACGRYAWGVAALAYLYEQLGDASLASTKQMAGYLTLFQSWIYEHFPGLGRRRLVTSYDDTTPRAMRWQSPRQSSTLAEIRSQLDALTYSGVVWHPYEGHRGIRPFFGICMYSGWIRIGDTLWRHLPERVLRQFGFQQDIPRSPTTVPDADVVAIDHMWLHFRAHVVSNVRHAASPSDCVDGYIQWFRRVSHPYIIVTADDARPALAPRQRPDVPREARPHRRSSPPSPSGALPRFRRMARMLQSLISCRHVTEGTVAHQVSVDLLQIANEGIDEYSTPRREQRHVRGRRSTSN
ncbi:protein MAINTENANCE OF MERISTEMS-like [Vigna angularis]|uniref:protein MAINTENANCE OF MERISTEMS-like n=3 Tax=Phaseolus angularis TaxID=3914 RepID=UPI0022B4A7B6|nr:protein MAINTENANCE OF MERISTEMS-like [Vigna angularis]